MLHLNIRTMTNSDISEVIAIDGQCFSEAANEKFFHDAITANQSRTTREPVVACDKQGRIIGYAYWSFDNTRELRIEAICVREGFRRQGVGTSLIEYIRKQMKRSRIHVMKTLVHDAKLDAQLFFRSHRFVGTCTSGSAYWMRFITPLDDLSGKHIAAIATECRQKRHKQQKENR